MEPIGFDLDVAENGHEALRLIQKNTYDLVLSDVIMPFMSGYELVEAVRADPKIAMTPIFAISASLMQVSAMEKKRMRQFDNFIAKPVNAKELFDAIRIPLHIDWLYSNSEPIRQVRSIGDEATSNGADSDRYSDPTQKLQQDLLILARLGDVKALLEQLPKLNDLNTIAAKKVKAYLKNYKMEQVITELESSLEKNPRA